MEQMKKLTGGAGGMGGAAHASGRRRGRAQAADADGAEVAPTTPQFVQMTHGCARVSTRACPCLTEARRVAQGRGRSGWVRERELDSRSWSPSWRGCAAPKAAPGIGNRTTAASARTCSRSATRSWRRSTPATRRPCRANWATCCCRSCSTANWPRRRASSTSRDVLQELRDKLVTRHPHVFGELQIETADAVVTEWESIKRRERQQTPAEQVAAGVPEHLPALAQRRDGAPQGRPGRRRAHAGADGGGTGAAPSSGSPTTGDAGRAGTGRGRTALRRHRPRPHQRRGSRTGPTRAVDRYLRELPGEIDRAEPVEPRARIEAAGRLLGNPYSEPVPGKAIKVVDRTVNREREIEELLTFWGSFCQ